MTLTYAASRMQPAMQYVRALHFWAGQLGNTGRLPMNGLLTGLARLPEQSAKTLFQKLSIDTQWNMIQPELN